jgi:hypothetical protein
MKQPPARRIDAGKKWGADLKIRATPTVLVNGWWMPQPLDSTRLTNAILAFDRPPLTKMTPLVIRRSFAIRLRPVAFAAWSACGVPTRRSRSCARTTTTLTG